MDYKNYESEPHFLWNLDVFVNRWINLVRMDQMQIISERPNISAKRSLEKVLQSLDVMNLYLLRSVTVEFFATWSKSLLTPRRVFLLSQKTFYNFISEEKKNWEMNSSLKFGRRSLASYISGRNYYFMAHKLWYLYKGNLSLQLREYLE